MADMRQKNETRGTKDSDLEIFHHLPEPPKKYAQLLAVCPEFSRENSIMSHWSRWLKGSVKKSCKVILTIPFPFCMRVPLFRHNKRSSCDFLFYHRRTF